MQGEIKLRIMFRFPPCGHVWVVVQHSCLFFPSLHNYLVHRLSESIPLNTLMSIAAFSHCLVQIAYTQACKQVGLGGLHVTMQTIFIDH